MQLYNYENQQNRTKILFYTIFMTLTIKQTFFLSTVFFVSQLHKLCYFLLIFLFGQRALYCKYI